jgi:hypothetical protein
MKVRATLGVLATLAVCFLAEKAAADDLKKVASFKLDDRQVQWVALSPDGTRLAASVVKVTNEKNKKTAVSQAVIWDLTTSAELSSREIPGTVAMSYLFFSANGKTLITVDDGFNTEGGNNWVRGGLQTRNGYQAWDATTGREIGSRIAPARLAEFTTAAVSPDGKYLATVFNSQVTIDRSPSRSSFAG